MAKIKLVKVGSIGGLYRSVPSGFTVTNDKLINKFCSPEQPDWTVQWLGWMSTKQVRRFSTLAEVRSFLNNL